MITLTEILRNLNIKWEDLNAEEKKTYSLWEQVLKGEISVENITSFLKAEIDRIEAEWSIPDNSQAKDLFLKAEMRCIKTLLAFVENPQRSKEFLERHIQTLFPKK